jgi:tRNA1Val (adenine37-N6)-methyltransferase
MNDSFRFKQFAVFHDRCAMKVGTDGVLLGAWADCSNAETILDIGSGSGLIALMLAQRSPARIDAIDIDEDACQQAKINFENAPFRDRLSVYFSSLQDFFPSKKYDLVVSNPPYFSRSLQSPDKNRTLARHNQTLPFDELITNSCRLLSSDGKLALILPFDAFDSINPLALEQNLFLCRKEKISPVWNHPPKRILLEYSVKQYPLIETEIHLEDSNHARSEDYQNLTKDFYLDGAR